MPIMQSQISNKVINIQPVIQRFKLDINIIQELKNRTPEFGFNGLGELVFRRTYSRDNEDWADVVIRVTEGCMSIRKEHFYRNSLRWVDSEWQFFAKNMANSLFSMEWLPPGRGLWMMGTDFTYERGSMSLNNCAATDTLDDLVLSAEWTMDCLMNGVGVGFTTNWRGKATKPDKSDCELFIIPDSREGWVESLIKLMCSYVESPRHGKNKFPIFDYSNIRKSGLPIKGFGGTASGPDPLKQMHERVESYLDAFCDGRLKCKSKTWKEIKNGDKSEWKEVEIDVDKPYSHTRLIADIFNSIGACVVAGNVRRCLPGDSMVHTRKGMIPIKDIEIGTEVLTSKGYEKVVNKFEQGIQKLITISTKNGKFKCTEDHKMAIVDAFTPEISYKMKKAKDIKTGDFMITTNIHLEGEKKSYLPEEFKDKLGCDELTPEICFLFGLMQSSDSHAELAQVVLDCEIDEKIKRDMDNGIIRKMCELFKQNDCICQFMLTTSLKNRLMFIMGILYRKSSFFSCSEKVGNFLYQLSCSCGIVSNLINGSDGLYYVGFDYNNVREKLSNPNCEQKLIPVEVFNVECYKNTVEEETFDIEVENLHEFFCNGYLSSNSAEICLGSPEDEDFINLKNYDMHPERSNIGWMSNNSVVLRADKDFEDFSYIPDLARRIRDNGEPGMINLHNIQKYGRYGKEIPDKATLVNPCFSGDTKIAVADGRGFVSIKQLADEQKDVPVYSIDELSGKVSVQFGRHPRITGVNQKLVRIYFDNGEFIDVTPNHKFFLTGGLIVEAKNIQKGFSVPQFEKKFLSQSRNRNMNSIRTFTSHEHHIEQTFEEYYDKIKHETSYMDIHCEYPDSQSLVVKTCENCGVEFLVKWEERELAYCSRNCSLIFTRERDSKNNGQTMRCVGGYSVSKVEELEGEHTVYNITVDINHTVAIVTKIDTSDNTLNGIFTRNCGEIALENFELCNLSEVFPPRCDSPKEFYGALEYATFYASTVSLLPTGRSETNAVLAGNRRIGVGISGIAQLASGAVPKNWGQVDYTRLGYFLREAYKIVRTTNKELARASGVPESVRVTTVKPSGSISLLAGCTPGVHYPISRYAIRRVRIGKISPIVQSLIDAGVPHEDDKFSEGTYVFEFVIDHGDVRPCEEVSPWEQFSLVQMLQKHYSDNCVSATIYFDKVKDGPDVEKMLAMFIPSLKSVSMLPHSGHGYAQAPYEPISKEEYERRLSMFKYPEYSKVKNNVPVGSKFCSGDHCEL